MDSSSNFCIGFSINVLHWWVSMQNRMTTKLTYLQKNMFHEWVLNDTIAALQRFSSVRNPSTEFWTQSLVEHAIPSQFTELIKEWIFIAVIFHYCAFSLGSHTTLQVFLLNQFFDLLQICYYFMNIFFILKALRIIFFAFFSVWKSLNFTSRRDHCARRIENGRAAITHGPPKY